MNYMNYVVNSNPVLTDAEINGTLDQAKAYADSHVEYTTKDIVISIKDGVEVCKRPWVLVGIGKFSVPTGAIRCCDGYYGPWQKC